MDAHRQGTAGNLTNLRGPNLGSGEKDQTTYRSHGDSVVNLENLPGTTLSRVGTLPRSRVTRVNMRDKGKVNTPLVCHKVYL